MYTDHLDNDIRNRLKRYPSDLDAGLLWKKIDAKRSATSNRRRKWRLLTTMLLLCLFAGCGTVMTFTAIQASQSKFTVLHHDPIQPQSAHYKKRLTQMIVQHTIKNDTKDQENPIDKTVRLVSEVSSNFHKSSQKQNEFLKRKTNLAFELQYKSNSMQHIDTLQKAPPKTKSNIELLKLPTLFPFRITRLPTEQQLYPLKTANSIEASTINTISWSAYFNGSHAIRKLSGGASDYVILRNSLERRNMSRSGGLLVNFPLAKRLSLSSGIHYQKTIEKLSYQHVSSSIIRTANELVQRNTLRNKTHYNTIEQIGVPILISYTKNTNRWSLGLRCGSILNLNQWVNGEIPAMKFGEGNFMQINQEGRVYKSRIGASIISSLFARYKLSPSYQIYINSGINYLPGSITHNDYVLDQRYTFLFFGIGIKGSIN